VTVVLTANCNLRCAYCYQNAKGRRQMDWKTLQAAIELLLRSRRRALDLVFYGGEPLLEFSLVRRAVEYVVRERPAGKSVGYAIITNGTLLNEERAGFLARHGFGIQLSFDGVPAAQSLRGPATFARLDSMLTRLRRDHPRWLAEKLRVAITVLPDTAQHLAESVDYLVGKGVREIDLSPATGVDTSWEPDRIEQLDAAFGRLFDWCARHYRRTGEVPLKLFRKGRSSRRSTRRTASRPMCGVGLGEQLTVDVDGGVHGCATFAGSYQQFPPGSLLGRVAALALGPIDSAGLAAALARYPGAVRRAELFDDKQGKYSSYGACRDCRHLATCTVCPMAIGYPAGNRDPRRIPDFDCAFNLVTHEYRRRFPRHSDGLDLLLGRPHVPELMQELRAFVGAHGREGRAR